MIKKRIREHIWTTLDKRGVALFPGPYGRIPNFKGSDRASLKATELEVWRRAKSIKSNPDSPQRKLRELALREGKIVFMAVPRLRELKCFIKLDPAKLGKNIDFASTIKGAFRLGEKVHPKDMPPIDLVIAGSVAVNKKGARLGKGGGYSDIEFALGRHFGIIKEDTPVLTTVHPLQIVEDDIPMKKHDIPVDFIVTPEEVIETHTKFKKPEGIYWDILDEEKIESIPILRKLRGEKK